MLFVRTFIITLLAACALASPFSALLLRGVRDVTGQDYYCSPYSCPVDHLPKDDTLSQILQQEGAEKTVTVYCEALQDVLSCAHWQVQECDAVLGASETVTKTQAISDYMCSGRGRQLAKEEAECVLGWRLQGVISDCFSDPTGDLCSDLDSVNSCTVNTIREQCSDDAAEFAAHVTYYTLSPEAATWGCDLTPPLRLFWDIKTRMTV